MTAHSTGALSEAARVRAFSLPIEQIDGSDPQLFEDDTVGHYFARLRRADPVHLCYRPVFGKFR